MGAARARAGPLPLAPVAPRPADPGGSPRVRLACADDDAPRQSLPVFWKYEPDRLILTAEDGADPGSRGFNRATASPRSSNPALALHRRHRSAPVPGAVPRPHPPRRVPDEAAAQGAAAAAPPPVPRRLHPSPQIIETQSTAREQQAALPLLPTALVYAETTIVFPFCDYAAF